MISAIIFDFDGTLVDSNATKRQGFFEVVSHQRNGPERMAKVLGRVAGDREAVFSAYVSESNIPGPDSTQAVQELVRAYSERVDALVARANEMPGATSLLQQLRSHHRRLFLSSATPISSLRRILDARGWLPFFEAVCGLPASKYESIRKIQGIAKVDVASLAVVGDGDDDRDSAASLGCAFFAVGEARGATTHERVYTLPELYQALVGHAGSCS